ncbi:MAG: hypothetical protein KatS3mg109_0778 [Pirellulaceae bacterium]|nr:MAG: hypothetical protein KatS3mg109_0778 [Pirellulaceae bacterium]
MNGKQIGIALAFVLTLFEFGLPAALLVAALVAVAAYPDQATGLANSAYRLLTDRQPPALPEPAEEKPGGDNVRQLSQDFSVYIPDSPVTATAEPGEPPARPGQVAYLLRCRAEGRE